MGSTTQHTTEPVYQVPTDEPRLTLFTVVKPFQGLAAIHQRNALQSWRTLGPDVDIIVFSDSPLPEDVQNSFRCELIEERNEHGTPRLDDIFLRATAMSDSALMGYVNADILLGQEFMHAIRQLFRSDLKYWLAIGRRKEADIQQVIDAHATVDVVEHVLNDSSISISDAAMVCKDFFVFHHGLFRDIPPFLVGRGNWDNWMVTEAKRSKIPVVDLSPSATVIHQKHDYGHLPGGRWGAYVSGPEAVENQRLAGGRNLIRGSTADWTLTRQGLRNTARFHFTFFRDSLNFVRLLRDMLLKRH